MRPAKTIAWLEDKLGHELPVAYVRFLEADEPKDAYVWNLPFRSPSEKLSVMFVSPTSFELFETAGLEPVDHVPLCICGSERLLLAVDLSSDDCPVCVCDDRGRGKAYDPKLPQEQLPLEES